MKKSKPWALAALLLTGCVLPPSDADRLTFEAVAPDHARYVQADPTMPADAKQRRLDLLEAWRLRVGGAR